MHTLVFLMQVILLIVPLFFIVALISGAVRKKVATQTNLILFFLGPLIILIFSLLGYALIPYGPGLTIGDMPLGILYMLAVSFIFYGILLADWYINYKLYFLANPNKITEIKNILTVVLMLFKIYEKIYLLGTSLDLDIISFINTSSSSNSDVNSDGSNSENNPEQSENNSEESEENFGGSDSSELWDYNSDGSENNPEQSENNPEPSENNSEGSQDNLADEGPQIASSPNSSESGSSVYTSCPCCGSNDDCTTCQHMATERRFMDPNEMRPVSLGRDCCAHPGSRGLIKCLGCKCMFCNESCFNHNSNRDN